MGEWGACRRWKGKGEGHATRSQDSPWMMQGSCRRNGGSEEGVRVGVEDEDIHKKTAVDWAPGVSEVGEIERKGQWEREGEGTEARAPSVPDGPHNRERYTQRRKAVPLSLANNSTLNTGCRSCSHLERDPITVRMEERRQGRVLWRGRQKRSKEILAPNVSKFSRPTVWFYRWRDLSIKKWKPCLDHSASRPQTSAQCTRWPPSVMERKGKKRPRECRDSGN